MKFITVLLFTLLAGCTSLHIIPKKAQPAETVEYTAASELPIESAPPWKILQLPEYPTVSNCTYNSVQYACFDRASFFTLLELKDMSKGNQAMLVKIDALYRSNIQERNNVVGIAQDYETKVNLLQKEVANKDAEIANNKREYFIRTWLERAAFVVLLYLK